MLAQDDSVCDASARVINGDHHVPESTPKVIHLIRAGTYWWALDTLDRMGEWREDYLLDKNLKIVMRIAY